MCGYYKTHFNPANSKKLSFILSVKPDELKMNIGDAVKENDMKSIECNASSSNPASSVGMEFLLDGKKQKYNKLQETETDGPHNGMVKTFVFMFITTRSQNGKVAQCRLLWDDKYINLEKETQLNITCKQCFLDNGSEFIFYVNNGNSRYIL